MITEAYYRSIKRDADATLDTANKIASHGQWEIAERLYLRAYFCACDARDKAFAALCHHHAEWCARKLGRAVCYDF